MSQSFAYNYHPAAAGEQVAMARKIVRETGYARREREVAWLE
jgi:hypothetical protein